MEFKDSLKLEVPKFLFEFATLHEYISSAKQEIVGLGGSWTILCEPNQNSFIVAGIQATFSFVEAKCCFGIEWTDVEVYATETVKPYVKCCDTQIINHRDLNDLLTNIEMVVITCTVTFTKSQTYDYLPKENFIFDFIEFSFTPDKQDDASQISHVSSYKKIEKFDISTAWSVQFWPHGNTDMNLFNAKILNKMLEVQYSFVSFVYRNLTIKNPKPDTMILDRLSKVAAINNKITLTMGVVFKVPLPVITFCVNVWHLNPQYYGEFTSSAWNSVDGAVNLKYRISCFLSGDRRSNKDCLSLSVDVKTVNEQRSNNELLSVTIVVSEPHVPHQNQPSSASTPLFPPKTVAFTAQDSVSYTFPRLVSHEKIIELKLLKKYLKIECSAKLVN